jgi:hypothetical protein
MENKRWYYCYASYGETCYGSGILCVFTAGEAKAYVERHLYRNPSLQYAPISQAICRKYRGEHRRYVE